MNLFRKNLLYRRVLAADALSVAGDAIYYIALMTYASQLPNSSQAIWWISLSEMLPGMLYAFFGVLADRSTNRTNRLLRTYGYRTLCYLAVGILIGYAPSLPLIAVIALLNFGSDLFGKLASSLMTPFFVQIVQDNELEEANGWKSAVERIMGVSAQFTGTFLILWFSYRSLAWFNGATFAIGGLLLLSISKRLVHIENAKLQKTKKPEEGEAAPSYWSDLKQSIKLLYRNKPVFFLVVQVTLINAALFPLTALFTMYAAAGDGFIIRSFSFTLALFSSLGSAGVVLGNVLTGKWLRTVPLTGIIGSNYIAVFGFCLGLWTGQLGLTLLMYMLACACVGALSPKYGAMFAREVEREHLASISGVSNTLGNIGGPLSQVLVGGAASCLSLAGGTTALSGLVIGGFGLLVVGVRKNHKAQLVRESDQ
ncbi:MFS transporter [Gorillibacterium timonense]|uniref:MFS transporter n=1 Tax=Gorillibacterium timonense TaxID=1689269 RepID=UPI00071E066C|nr:MFS transporter [Gorillibacterium timonense]